MGRYSGGEWGETHARDAEGGLGCVYIGRGGKYSLFGGEWRLRERATGGGHKQLILVVGR